jgi:hypothetical protein
MFRVIRPARLFVVIGLVIALAVAALGDTLRLKDGSIIKGRIVSFSGGKFVVVIGEGTARQRQLTFEADEVASIQFDSVMARNSAPASNSQAQRVPAADDDYTPPKNPPKVITTDPINTSTAKNTPAKEAPQTVNKESPTVTMEPVRHTGGKPIEVQVKVRADNATNGWTNSGWVVRKGQRIRIIGDGSISLGKGRNTGPSGLYDVEDSTKLLKSVPTGALIAVIGDDNNEFIYVGSERTFVATRDGALFLGVNEGNLDDNSGTFSVRIEIEPA